MKKFMLVYTVEGEQEAIFSDDYLKISRSKMDVECGFGGYAEMYERMEDEDGMEAYVLVEA